MGTTATDMTYDPSSLVDPSYDEIVDSFGYESDLAAVLGEWQGDYVYLLKDGDRRGILVVGYGSCSGCDVLEGCQGPSEVRSLASKLYGSIRWFDDLTGLKLWLMTSTDWYRYDVEFQAWAEGFIGGGFAFR